MDVAVKLNHGSPARDVEAAARFVGAARVAAVRSGHAVGQEEGVRGVRRARAIAPGLGGRRGNADGGADREGQEPHRAHPEGRRPHQALRLALRAVRRSDQEAARARLAARAAQPGGRSRQEDRRPDGLAQAEPARISNRCARRFSGLLQVARRNRQAARQAGLRPRRARGLQRADDRARHPRPRARSQDGRHPRQDDARRRRHPEGHAARTKRWPSSTRSSRG